MVAAIWVSPNAAFWTPGSSRKWGDPSWSTFCARLTNKNNKNRIKISGWLGPHFWLPAGRCSIRVILEVFPMQNTNSGCDLGSCFGGLFDAKHKWWLRSGVFLWRPFRCKTRIVAAIWGALAEAFLVQITHGSCDLGVSECCFFGLSGAPKSGGSFLDHFLCSPD